MCIALWLFIHVCCELERHVIHVYYSPLKFILHHGFCDSVISYFFPVMSIVWKLMLIFQLLQWQLCYSCLSKCRFVWYSHRKQDTSPLATQMVVYCNCRICMFCEGREERQHFHLPQAAKSFEKALCSGSAEVSHYLVTRLGVIYCWCLLHAVVGLIPMMETRFLFP